MEKEKEDIKTWLILWLYDAIDDVMNYHMDNGMVDHKREDIE